DRRRWTPHGVRRPAPRSGPQGRCRAGGGTARKGPEAAKGREGPEASQGFQARQGGEEGEEEGLVGARGAAAGSGDGRRPQVGRAQAVIVAGRQLLRDHVEQQRAVAHGRRLAVELSPERGGFLVDLGFPSTHVSANPRGGGTFQIKKSLLN